MSSSDIFGEPLAKDPTIALPNISVAPRITPGPVRKQQFVVELVGPRTAPSPNVKVLLDAQWQGALGNPQVFVMSGADQYWRPLEANDPSGSYDSIALAWDLISPKGQLSANAAQQLWNVAENFAGQISRRAMAMPVPADVEPTIRALEELGENLDIGVNFTLVPRMNPFPEKEVWRLAAALGLQYSPNGTFTWLAQGSELPLLELSPGDADRFTLAQVQAGITHPALGLGFSVPLCPNPEAALDGCFRVGTAFSSRLSAALVDEDFKPVDDGAKRRIASDLRQAVQALERAGFAPGSTEAIKLYSNL